MRRNVGCAEYLEDIIDLLNDRKYHWAFYSFRETAWDGYNYELGTEGFSWQYWKDLEDGKNPASPYDENKNNVLWRTIQKGLNAPK